MIIEAKDEKGAPKAPPLSFPSNGATPACLRALIPVGDSTIPLLQPAGEASPDIVVALVNDAGTVVTSERVLLGKGYTTKIYAVAQMDTLPAFETLPTADQIGAIINGKDRKGGAVQSRTVVKADGSTSVNISSDMFK